MPRLAERAERRKLARTLDTDAAALDFLDDCAAAELRGLREGVTDALFKRHASSFRLLANLSGLLPAGLIARIARHALGAFLSGRVTGEMPVKRAVAVANKLPAEFLADISLSIEPSRAEAVIAGMPTDTVETVAKILVRRDEFVTMGRFVGAVSEDALFRVADLLDDQALLHIGFYVEDATRLDRILEYFSGERLQRVIHTATEQDLWPEALSLVQVVGDEQKGRLGDLVAAEDEAVLDSLVHVAQDQGLWPEVLTAVSRMSADNQRKVVNLPSVTEPAVLDALMAASNDNQLWHLALPMVAQMTPDNQDVVVNLPSVNQPQVLDTLMGVSHEHNLWHIVVALVARMDPAAQQSAIQALVAREDDVLLAWLESLDATVDMLAHAQTILRGLSADLREQCIQRAQRLAADNDKLAGLVARLGKGG